jgi:hypothetical protein
MALTIQTTRSTELPLPIAQQIQDRLTKPNSETHHAIKLVISGLLGNTPADIIPDFPMATATVVDPFTDEMLCVGWSSATIWDRLVCLQVFVSPDYRGIGMAGALTTALMADKILSPEMPLGVFSDECYNIAKSRGFSEVRQYKLVEDGWIRVNKEASDEQRRTTDEERVLNAEGALRHLPLADGKVGQMDGGSSHRRRPGS